jgi:hypothetical protein
MVKKLIVYIAIIFSIFIPSDQSILAHNAIFSKTSLRSTPINIPIFKLKDYHNLPKNTIYSEVLSYSKHKSFGNDHGRPTNIHETVHGINNYLNNTFASQKVRGFYAGNGRAILLQQPDIKLSNVPSYIPTILREYRYKTYFVQLLNTWNDVPLYPIDEWSAYIAGAECAVDDFRNNIKEKERFDSVSGALEFSIYCVALAISVKNDNSIYWYTYPEFKNTIHFYLIKSEKIFFEGKDIFPSKAQEKLLYNLRTHEDAVYIRNFLATEFDGIFLP